MFELVPGLAKKIPVTELKLCKVLFENNRFYPWIFLVPKRENAKNMTFLSMEDRLQLMREMALCEKVMTELFPHDQTNVAMIGNKTPRCMSTSSAAKKATPTGRPPSGTIIPNPIRQTKPKKPPPALKMRSSRKNPSRNMRKIKHFLRN